MLSGRRAGGVFGMQKRIENVQCLHASSRSEYGNGIVADAGRAVACKSQQQRVQRRIMTANSKQTLKIGVWRQDQEFVDQRC